MNDSTAANDVSDFQTIERLNEPQVQQLHALYQLEWWTVGRRLEDVREMLENSTLVFGWIEPGTGRLVAFCRVLTDFLYHATLYDVIVAAEHRGHGMGRKIMDRVIGHPRLQRVRAVWLCCLPEMVPFYEKWGFATTESESKWMRRLRTDA